jgi:Glycosyl transferases group 1
VEFLGVVPELRGYYDETDLVLLPIVTGGGVAIKTLEAVLHERPVLATRHALRGLPDDVVRTIGHEDNPEQYARSLLAIVADPERHQARLDGVRQAAELLRGYAFYRTLGKAVDAVRLSGPRYQPAIGQERSNPIDP